MSGPLFSIIIVCLNAEAHISEALESVRVQGLDDYELVVADGGSTDGTLAVLEAFEPLFGGRMRWLSERDSGIYDAMNRALARATGEYVQFLGADDRLRRGALQAVADALGAAPRPDMVSGATHVFGPDAEWDDPARRKIRRGLAQRPPSGHQATFVRRDAIEAVGGFDRGFPIAADYDLYLRLIEAGRTECLLDRVLSDFRLGGLSSRSAWATARAYRDVRVAHGANRAIEDLVALKSTAAATVFAAWARRFRRASGVTRPPKTRETASGPPRVAYLSLQAVVDGQDTWAAVTEVIGAWEAEGWTVDRYFPAYLASGAPGGLGRLAEMWRVQRRLNAHLGAYDAVYVRAHQMALPSARRARARGVPVVQECNGPYEDLFIAYPRLRALRVVFDAMQRWQYRHASAIVSVAEGLTAWLRREAGHDRVTTIGNGANIELFTPLAPGREGLPERFAVFFGQFPAWQGIASLLEAVRLPGWPSGLALVFIGDGAKRGDIEAAAAAMPGRVLYLGRLPYHEVPQVVAHAAVAFVPMMAPERETMFSPLKLYESMACGVPVVASDVVGISEVVNEWRCGILFPAGDARAIAEATSRVIGGPAEACEMGRRGREGAVACFSWQARAAQRARVVESVIERR